MRRHGIQQKGLAVLFVLSCCSAIMAETWRLKDGEEWQSVTADPQETYLRAIAELKNLVRTGESKAVEEALGQLKEEFPQYAGPDLDLFIEGELKYWKNRYSKAMVKYEKLLKDHPNSEFAGPAMDREFDMAGAYLGGRKKSVLGFIKIAGYAEGIEIMERLSDRAGLDDPNGVGLRAAVAVAEHYQTREQYLEAYLKWSEIASYWETGLIGKKALLRMAENNLAAYNVPSPKKRPRFDGSKLTTARTYYEKFMARYPEDAREQGIPQKIDEIDEQMAHKQFTVGQYYRRVGKTQAASYYFDMVVKNWPDTAAAEMARQALKENADEKLASEK